MRKSEYTCNQGCWCRRYRENSKEYEMTYEIGKNIFVIKWEQATDWKCYEKCNLYLMGRLFLCKEKQREL